MEFLSFEESMLVLESSTSPLLHLPSVHQFTSHPFSSYFQAAVALEWDAIVPSRPLNSPTWKTHSSVKRSELVHVAATATAYPHPSAKILRVSFSFLPLFANLRPLLFFLLPSGRGSRMNKVNNLSTARATIRDDLTNFACWG